MTVRHRGAMELGQTTKQRASLSCQPTQGESWASILPFKHLDKPPFVKWHYKWFSVHSTSGCQPSAGLKAHAAEVALAQRVPGMVTPRFQPCLPPQHDGSHPECTASSLASDPWLLTICHITQNNRHHKIACDPSLAYFSQIQELKKVSLRDFRTTFHFSNLFLLCQSCCCFAHIFDGLSHLPLYIHACLHTYKPIQMEPKE